MWQKKLWQEPLNWRLRRELSHKTRRQLNKGSLLSSPTKYLSQLRYVVVTNFSCPLLQMRLYVKCAIIYRMLQ